MKLKQLKEERGRVWDNIEDMRKKLTDEDRDFTNEEREAYDKASEDFRKLGQQITDLMSEDEMRRQMGERPGREDETAKKTNANFRTALRGWAKEHGQFDCEATEDEKAAMRHYGLTRKAMRLHLPAQVGMPGQHGEELRASVREKRAMTTGGTGAEYVAEDFLRELEVAMLPWGQMREHVRIIRSSTGGSMPMPNMNDTGNTGAQVNENTDISGDFTDPTTSEVVLGAYKFTSKPVLITQEMLEDSAFDLAAEITSALGMRLGRIQNTKMTTGTGSSTPKGITVAATAKAAAGATAITYADILGLKYAVNSAYRSNARYVLNDQLMPTLRLIKDDAGNYIFHGDLASPGGETLLGQPIVFNQDMASSVVASAKTIVYGDLSKYILREIRDIRFYRLTEHYRLTNDADAFVAYMRFDSDLQDAGTHPIKVLTQATGS